jgi:5-oxoprolinase (ATP-hydrolysing)
MGAFCLHLCLNSVYEAACNELLRRIKVAVAKIIDTQFTDEPSEFTDFIDDDGAGVGPYAVKCSMKKEDGKLKFDWSGTSVQSSRSINYLLSPTMFKMFVGYVTFSPQPHPIITKRFWSCWPLC